MVTDLFVMNTVNNMTSTFLLNLMKFIVCRALADADEALKIKSDWPKGYFRKAKALAGLEVTMEHYCNNLNCRCIEI